MAVSIPKFIPYEMKTSIVRISSYEGRSPRGVLFNSYYDGEKRFENLSQLIFLMEEMLDDLNYPQQTMKTRSYKTGGRNTVRGGEEEPHGKTLATFRIKVLFRQNASWQGSITWVEKEQESSFRSVLELVHLMDSALKV